MNTDHVVIDTRTQAFECRNCGASYKPNLPVPINLMVAMMQAFTKDHRRCKATKERK